MSCGSFPKFPQITLVQIDGRLYPNRGNFIALAGNFRSRRLVSSIAADLERSYNLCSDLGLVLKTVRQSGLAVLPQFRVRVGSPVRVMMAERLPSAKAIIGRLGTCSVESKLDGFRCELHIKNKQVEVFSRNLERTTEMFPDLVSAARKQLGSNTPSWTEKP